jgi:hypothetical protein
MEHNMFENYPTTDLGVQLLKQYLVPTSFKLDADNFVNHKFCSKADSSGTKSLHENKDCSFINAKVN